jgi:RNA polymerase sigma-70 factor (sigma-E family)
MAGMERPDPDPAEVGPASLSELFGAQYGPMVRLAHVLTGSNAVAEDLVQDCFVRLHRHWERTDNPGGYLRVSVVNACRSWHRSRFRERARLRRLAAGDQPVSLEARELLDALARLSYPQRAALVLRYYEGMREREIADALGCPPGTVKSHLYRGLEQLRKVIEQ